MTNVKLTQINVRKLGKANCRPCQIIGYALAAEAEKLEALNATIIEHDIEKEPEILDKYNKPDKPITGVPVLVFERNGIEMARINGICNIDEVYGAIEFAKTAK